MPKRFRMDNTEGYSAADLAALNDAFEASVEGLRACGADWDYDSLAQKSWEDHLAETLLARYDAGERGESLLR